MFSDNPFDCTYEPLDPDLDSVVYGMYEADKLSRIFNPAHHRFVNWLISLIPSLPQARYDYEVDSNDNIVAITWAGTERRHKPRENSLSRYIRRATVSMRERARHHMLPKTQKVRKVA